MVLADRGRGFVQEIAAGVGDFGVDFLNLSFRFFPVVAELLFVCHAPLVLGELGLLNFKAVERGNVAAIRERGKTGYAQVNANTRGGYGCWLPHFSLGLDAFVWGLGSGSGHHCPYV